MPGEYFYVYNRGAFNQNIFKEHADWKRFLFSVLYSQSPTQMKNIQRHVKTFSASEGFEVSGEDTESVLENRFVELTAFCLMPNHFHLLIKETEENGIPHYMQRIANGYTKYFNTKYGTNGRIFQGPYQIVHVKNSHQLLYLSAYIHQKPRELKAWKGKEFEYPWSSLQDLTEANRWGGLLEADIIAEQFEAEPDSNYADFVRTSRAKDFEKEIPELIL